MHSLFKVAVLAAFSALTAHSFAADNYKVRDLAPEDGSFVWGDAPALNIHGQVGGYGVMPNGDWHAVLTGPNGKGVADLGTLPGGSKARVRGINSDGDVVGDSDTPAGKRGFYLLSWPGSEMESVAGPVTGINIRRGILIIGGGGSCFYTIFRGKATCYGHRTSLAINDKGMVTGNDISTPGGEAFFSPHSGKHEQLIGLLDGDASAATALDSDGRVVGWVHRASGNQAFVTDPAGVNMRYIPLSGNAADSRAYGIGDLGQVVGYYSRLDTGKQSAFLATAPDYAMVDLNTLAAMPAGVAAQSALSVNGKGQITVKGSNNHYYLLTPR